MGAWSREGGKRIGDPLLFERQRVDSRSAHEYCGLEVGVGRNGEGKIAAFFLVENALGHERAGQVLDEAVGVSQFPVRLPLQGFSDLVECLRGLVAIVDDEGRRPVETFTVRGRESSIIDHHVAHGLGIVEERPVVRRMAPPPVIHHSDKLSVELRINLPIHFILEISLCVFLSVFVCLSQCVSVCLTLLV